MIVISVVVGVVVVTRAKTAPPTPPPPPPPDKDKAYLAEKFRGCPDVSPDKWTINNYKDGGPSASMQCQLKSETVVGLQESDYASQTYKLVFRTTGAQIYDDLFADGAPKKYWYNYGDYKEDTKKWHCMNEPTGTNTNYMTTSDVNKNKLAEKTGDSIVLHSKLLQPKYPQRASVRIHTKISFVYGIHAFRINSIPDNSSTGVWPAAWQAAPYDCSAGIGTSTNYAGNWPISGETDIFEAVENSDITSSLHVICRNSGTPIQMMKGIDKKPGWYVCMWTPRYLQMYYMGLDEGDEIFGKDEIIPSRDFKPEDNKTSSDNKDSNTQSMWGVKPVAGTTGGADVVSTNTLPKHVHVDSSSNSMDWIVSEHQQTNTKLCYSPVTVFDSNNPVQDKKQVTFLNHGPDASKGGGFLTILNVATCSEGLSNENDLKFEVSAYKVWQIQETKF